FQRYKDIDGDGITYRTLPGNRNPAAAWFGRGTGHDESAHYSENSGDWQRNMDRLARKLETARSYLPTPVVAESAPSQDKAAALGVIYYGTTRYAIEEARDRLAAQGCSLDLMRIRALPLSPAVEEFVASHDQVAVIEMNRD